MCKINVEIFAKRPSAAHFRTRSCLPIYLIERHPQLRGKGFMLLFRLSDGLYFLMLSETFL
ncbi:hypothetical protein BV912_06985 [Neisseria dumasiana]|uniref:Uncharacterized protein n=1 Tax=Neisseria dumasiana TaxID=1931275 RepID=A0A1X3DIA8_9NEIS|nr:hypothetical protein BV912_06985 [Neisseria dumasiana]